MFNTDSFKFSRGKNSVPLDTLAQLATPPQKEGLNGHIDPKIELVPCTLESDKKTLQKRAYRNYVSTPLALRLVDASKINPKSTLEKSYFNTYHCCSTLAIHSTGKVVGNYCKNRWCIVCNSIRTAVLIHKYMPIIDEWDDKHFVTLTLPNCKDFELKSTIKLMQKNFNQIRKVLQKRYQRNKSDKLVGLRKLECTYNSTRDDFHPHYHFVIDGHDNAHELVDLWLKKSFNSKRIAQDVREADNDSAKELFKYFTKVVTPTKNKKGETVDMKIYADAMDVIFNSIKGVRTFQNFGFKVGKKVESEDFTELSGDPVVSTAKWVQELGDWAEENGELLSGYVPLDKTKKLVKNKIIVRDNFHTKQLKIFK